MIDRPLFDRPATKPKRRARSMATPVIPVSAKVPPESWTIRFTSAPGHTAPPVCRIRCLLKTAWRRHRLRAKILAGPMPDCPVIEPTASISSEVPRGPETTFNEAGKNEVVAGMTGRMER